MSRVTTPGAVADAHGKDGADATDHEFWHTKWRSNQIGFHEEAIHPLLQAHWDALDVARGDTVFVPLCGKSHDMSWLHARSCHVVGVEISELAEPVRNFVFTSHTMNYWIGDRYGEETRRWDFARAAG